MKSIVTYKFRVKDKHAAELNRQARAVNLVWNYCNDAMKHAKKWGTQWPNFYELSRLTSGSCKELGLHSGTVQRTCREFDTRRTQFKKLVLRYRGKKSLGWVPFNTGHCKHAKGGFDFFGHHYTVWLSRELPAGAKIRAGSFNQDARGRWYINVPVEVEFAENVPAKQIGIDLGLKDIATCSDGTRIAAPQWYRKNQAALAVAQRACKKQRVRALSAKAANQRKDFLHKASTAIVKENGLVVVGDVSSTKLAKTKMAKSVLDAGWGMFREMLKYKAMRQQSFFVITNEAYTTQRCSSCGQIPASSPKGRAGLGIREWTCACGVTHDRDVNAAKNILAAGYRRPVEGITCLKTGEDANSCITWNSPRTN